MQIWEARVCIAEAHVVRESLPHEIYNIVEFARSQNSCILTSQLSTVNQQSYVSDKIIDTTASDNKVLILLAIFCSLFSAFTLNYLILENMSNNGRKCCYPCYI